MAEEKCHLSWPPWHTFTDHLKELLCHMKTDDTFADVTLVSDDGREVRAHKVVLGACSPMIKELLTKKDTNIIDLNGIAMEEINSILQFIYLGEVAICEGRMKEFFYAAQKLKIKELSKEAKMQVESKNKTNTQSTDNIQSKNEVAMYVSNQCDKQSKSSQSSLTRNIQKKPEGLKYPCNQCDYQATYSIYDLKKHIKSIHEGVKYACNQCDQQFKTQSNRARHIQSVHKGVKYDCNQLHSYTTE